MLYAVISGKQHAAGFHVQTEQARRRGVLRRRSILIGLPCVAGALAYWIYIAETPLRADETKRGLVVCAWFAVATLITVMLFLSERYRALAQRRINACLCPTCGYDLRETESRCPECGNQPEHIPRKLGLVPGREPRSFRAALLIAFSYCIAMMIISNPTYVRLGEWCYVRGRDSLEFALHFEQFDSDDWKNARVLYDGRTVRVKMVEDLMRRDDLVGMNSDQVSQLLGPPSLDPNEHCGVYAYFLQRKVYGNRNWFSWTEEEYVVFAFWDDRVKQVYIRENDRIPNCSNAASSSGQ